MQFLYGLQQHGIKLGLETVRALLTRVGEPQRRYPVIHIGGTNGKGSTAAMVASILQAAGPSRGTVYLAAPDRFSRAGPCQWRHGPRRPRERSGRSPAGGRSFRSRPDIFEFTTALAFQYFAECHVDVAVLEVGLGGRFDATNVVEPLATAITTIGLDHEAYFGSTLESIAFEKAGIIKPSVPLVIGRIDAPARQVIEERALTQAAPVYPWIVSFAAKGHQRQTVTMPAWGRSMTIYPVRFWDGFNWTMLPAPWR